MPKARPLRDVLAENVRVLRSRRRLTQEALGKKAGISGRHVSLIENGDRNVTLATLEGVARALDVAVVDLLSDDSVDDPARGKQALRIAIRLLEKLGDKL